jgi:cytochrome P450
VNEPVAPFAVPAVLDADVDVMLDDLPDVPAMLHALRARGPAVWARAFGAPSLLLVGHELVNDAFRAEETFPSAEYYGRVVTDVLGRNLQCMYGDEHKLNRALVSPAFRQRLMPGIVGPLLEPVAHELVDRFVARGSADLVADFTARYPFIVITRLLGLPKRSEEDVRRWALGMLDIRNHEHARRCSHEFVAFVDPILQRRRTDPSDDLLSTLATTEVDGARLTDEEILNFLRLLFPAGADTTYLGLGSILLALLRDREQLDIVLADLATECRWAAEEGIRLDPPTAWIPRYNPRDITWHGIDIPAGTSMYLGVMAANRDPAAYPDPDRFDVRRRPTSVMTFGFGVHFCLGAHLARAELETALRVLLARCRDLRLAGDDGVRVTGTFHHLLRGPNRLPVRFRPAGRPS